MKDSQAVSKSFLQSLLWIVTFIGFAFWLCRPIRTNDIWWHLATGRYILDHFQIPHTDPFSWTMRGHVWIDFEWFYEVALYAAHAALGLMGILAIKIVLILGALFFQERRLKVWGVPWIYRLLSVFICFWASRYGWADRADLVSIFFTSVLLWACDSLSLRDADQRFFLLGPLLFIIWANAHGGFAIGLVVLGLYTFGVIRSEPSLRFPFMISSWASALGTLINPFGFHLHKFIFKAFQVSRHSPATEWQSTPWTHLEWYWICLAFFWIVWIMQILKKVRINVGPLLVSLFLSWFSARHVRNVPFFMMSAWPYAVVGIYSLGRYMKGIKMVQKYERSFLGVALAAAFAFSIFAAGQIRVGIQKNQFPIEACAFISHYSIPGPFYNENDFGSYWIWHFNGDPPVFIDGRSSAVDGYPKLRKDIQDAKRSPAQWQAFLSHYQVAAAVMAYPKPDPLNESSSLIENYFPPQNWALIYWDDLSYILLKRVPVYRSIIQKWEFKNVLVPRLLRGYKVSRK